MHPEIGQGAKDLPPPIYVECMAGGTWQLLGDHGVMGSKAGGVARNRCKSSICLLHFARHAQPQRLGGLQVEIIREL